MKQFKLWIHQPGNFREEALVLNAKDFPGIKAHDVVEIYHPEDDYSRLLLQVKSINKENDLQKDVISVAQTIATNFHLKMYRDVNVSIVNPKDVACDLVELTYKDQYFSRADMWRLRTSLIGTCMYLSQKICYAEMRAQVEELWSKGEKVKCGCITEDTRVTFRSSTAQVNIFIQMSSEMWEFDNYGDLYFEKAVDGFLVDLFGQWKELNCNHDVTITMFSRTFYDAKSIEEFPMHMRECVQQDYLGRFYEDFYRVVVQNEKYLDNWRDSTAGDVVVVQNERYDDWTSTIIQLKKLMIDYQNHVIRYHQREGVHVPRSWNSSASQGNFLEVLNMALNVFEKYFLDRCFDRTGKLSIVITPGPGVFEVDRELTNITKQRTIDCGNSSDLVCMGEQPLHAVPLFKFHNKNPSNTIDVGDDYNIPHWMNHSFYTSQSQAERICQGKFIPRIKTPQFVPSVCDTGMPEPSTGVEKSSQYLESDEMPFVDYDEYDAQVFKHASSHRCQGRKHNGLRITHSRDMKRRRVPRVRYTGNIRKVVLGINDDPTSPIDIPKKKTSLVDEFMSNSFGGKGKEISGLAVNADRMVGSAGSPVGHQGRNLLRQDRPQRALINPFAPSRLHFKVTSNRRRWAHAFPTDPQGASVQPHHQHSVRFSTSESQASVEVHSPPTREVIQAAQFAVNLRKHKARRTSDGSDTQESGRFGAKSMSASSGGESDSGCSLKDASGRENSHSSNLASSRETLGSASAGLGKGLNTMASSSTLSLSRVDSTSSVSSVINVNEVPRDGCGSGGGRQNSSGLTFSVLPPGEEGHNWLWGVTGEQEWTPEVKTGMDWKSMTIPASLPITTDYFPDRRSLQIYYVISDYNLLPEDYNCDQQDRVNKKPLTACEVYKEMIAQRLAQGFQIVILPKVVTPAQATTLSSSNFQTSSLIKSRSLQEPMEEIILSIGRIFHKLSVLGNSINVTRYWPRHPYPQKSYHYTYRFQVPDSENYEVSWTDFCNEKLENYNWNYLDQYLCTRGEDDFGLMETLKYWRARFYLLPCNNPATKKIIDGADRCDIYEERTIQDQHQLMDGFLRFMETANKIKRRGLTRMPKVLSSKDIPNRGATQGSGSHPHEKDGMGKVKAISKLTEGSDTPPNCGSLGIGSPVITSGDIRKGMQSGVESMIGSGTGTLSTSNVARFQDQLATTERHLELTMDSSSLDIIEIMLDQNEGLGFLKNQQGLPPLPNYAFVSAEAAMWLIQVVSGMETVQQATQVMQRLLDEGWICHASGNKRHKFIFGFFLYFIIPEKDKKAAESLLPHYDFYNMSFEYEWCEVHIHLNMACVHGTQMGSCTECSGLSFLSNHRPDKWQFAMSSIAKNDCQWNIYSESGLYKLVYVDIDPPHKSEREEWGTAHYHANYNPNTAFELVVQWLVATGCILGDLIQSWSRKATSCGFHFLPVPVDPFALPFTQNSDPLRGPIFVPLNIDCLSNQGAELFEDFSAESREERLFLFQDSILKRFGFMQDMCPMITQANTRVSVAPHPQYVHCSGGMFAMIPDTKTTSPRNKDGTHCRINFQVGSYSYKSCQWPESYGEQADFHDAYYRLGFLWSWNFMLTKRWRTSNTGDETFQDKMLADFRAFCANKDNRLRDYWDHCRALQCEFVERELQQVKTPCDLLKKAVEKLSEADIYNGQHEISTRENSQTANV